MPFINEYEKSKIFISSRRDSSILVMTDPCSPESSPYLVSAFVESALLTQEAELALTWLKKTLRKSKFIQFFNTSYLLYLLGATIYYKKDLVRPAVLIVSENAGTYYVCSFSPTVFYIYTAISRC